MANGPLPRQYRGIYEQASAGFTTVDVASIAIGAQGTVTITVPGVATDGTWVVDGITTTGNPGAVSMDAYISATNTVLVFLQNNSGGAVDPPLMTYRAVCLKLGKQMLL